MPEPYLRHPDVTLYVGDALDVLRELEDGCCDACVTSPPYMDARPEYPSPSEFQFELIFRELARVVDGPMLVNVGRLWRDRRELLWWTSLLERADWAGWTLRDTAIWAKPNANPIQGELLTNAHEYVFVFGDGCDPDAIRVPYVEGSIERLRRRHVSHVGVKGDANGSERSRHDANPAGARAPSVIVVPAGGEKGNPHPAPMPLELAGWLVRLSGGSRIIDPFAGGGTTLLAARRLQRHAVGIELNPAFALIAGNRLQQPALWTSETV